MTEPTEEQIDAMLNRTNALVIAALRDHPQRQRVLAILDAGGRLFCSRDGEQLKFVVGWFDDELMRPAEADPDEAIVVMRLPRRVLLEATDCGLN